MIWLALIALLYLAAGLLLLRFFHNAAKGDAAADGRDE